VDAVTLLIKVASSRLASLVRKSLRL
jgi:hypothetical protein